jgi:hypothetical protein
MVREWSKLSRDEDPPPSSVSITRPIPNSPRYSKDSDSTVRVECCPLQRGTKGIKDLPASTLRRLRPAPTSPLPSRSDSRGSLHQNLILSSLPLRRNTRLYSTRRVSETSLLNLALNVISPSRVSLLRSLHRETTTMEMNRSREGVCSGV